MTSLLSPRRLAALALAAAALSGFGSSASAAPVCNRTGAFAIHTAHEGVESAGAGTPAHPVTDLASGAVHSPVESTYCAVPLLP